MKYILSLFLFLIIPYNLFGQWIQLNTDTLNDYNSIYFLNADTGFVCGSVHTSSGGVILRTLNGGASWDTTLVGLALTDITFVNDSVGFTGGQDGGIYKTTDMGTTWYYLSSFGNNSDFSNFCFINQDTGIVHTFNGILGYFTPGQFPTSSNFFNSSAGTWYPGTGELNRMQNVYFAAGGYGQFLKSFDNGLTWNHYNSDPNIYIFDAKMTDQNHVVIVGGTDDQFVTGDTGKATVSFDGGSTWSPLNSFATHDIVGVDFYDNFHGYCVGGINSLFTWTGFKPMGSIWSTADGGLTWSLVDSSYNDQLEDVFIVNDSLAYAAGNNGYILKNTIHGSSLALPENVNMLNIAIYPNPVQSILTLNIKYPFSCRTSVALFDISGRLLSLFEISETENSLLIDTTDMEFGVYYIQVANKYAVTTRKVIKSK